MKNPVLWLAVVVCLETAMMMALPYLSPRQVYFGVRTGAEFRDTEVGRKLRTAYWVQVLIWCVVSLAAMLPVGLLSQNAAGFLAMLPIVGALAAFLRAYFQAKPHALPATAVREAELAPSERALPWWTWLALPPFAIPVAAMLYLRVRWDEIPARYPVHFGPNGEPDRWVARTQGAVFGPLWFAEGMLLLFLLLFAAVLIGSRKSVRPTAIPGMFVGMMYVMGATFSAVGLMPIVRVPAAGLIGLTMVFVAGVLVWGFRRNADPNAVAEATPDDCWTLGGIYKNPNDPAIFVQKRVGFGYTINFGNVWSYVVIGGFALGMMALAALLKWAQAG